MGVHGPEPRVHGLSAEDQDLFLPGTWAWSRSYQVSARVLSVEELWGEKVCLVWLAGAATVARLPVADLLAVGEMEVPGPADLAWVAAAARVVDALAQDVLLAPLEGAVLPLPHQIHALARAVAGDRVRFLLADEVGLGKTVEAGLILRELKLRGMVRRTLVVAPKGLVAQWVQEMRLHFNEEFHLLLGDDIRSLARRETVENPWRIYDQVVCPLDSVKPVESRRGWSMARIEAWNRERFENLLLGCWDLVIVDEAHRLGGNTAEVARHRLGLGLSQAAPYLLLLSATPHQGKTDGFHRLLNLVDAEAFPDTASVTRERVAPYCIRTEKRTAIDAEGKALFAPRRTILHPVAWGPSHVLQEALYEGVTSYVRWGYDRARQEKQNAVGFLMVLIQRMVTSSTRAIRATLERRQEVLDHDAPPPVEGTELEEHERELLDDLEAEESLDRLLRHRLHALAEERREVERLLSLARRAEAAGPDAKAEALLDWIRRLRREEGDLDLKVLVFTEFVATQEMLSEFLMSRGMTVVRLNGNMSLEDRRAAQRRFAEDAQALVSTEAGGEGLNLQFCHVVVNYDLPWNPMRLEQRIGRVDRIGQAHVVRAINLTLEDTVEHRVRQILEEKLRTILEEFGVDKTTDVLESVEEGGVFDELATRVVEDPQGALRRAEELAEQFRLRMRETDDSRGLLPATAELDPGLAREVRHHPLPQWLERLAADFVESSGGRVEREGSRRRYRLPDGEVVEGTFLREEAEAAGCPLLSLDTPFLRKLLGTLPLRAPGQPVARLRFPGIPAEVHGAWSLWRVGLAGEDPRDLRCLPVFVHRDGRRFRSTAVQLWDRVLNRDFAWVGGVRQDEVEALEAAARNAARELGAGLYRDLRTRADNRSARDVEKRRTALAARRRAIDRVGLETVRRHRERLLTEEEEALEETMRTRRAHVPLLEPLLLVVVEPAEP